MKIQKLQFVFFILFIGILINSCKDDEMPTPQPGSNGNKLELFATIDSVGYFSGIIDCELNQQAVYTIESYGYCWDFNNQPTVNNNVEEFSSLKETQFQLTCKKLESNTSYYIRAFVKFGEVLIYSNQIEFTTKDFATVIETGKIENISAISASYNGKVLNNGGIEIDKKGVCWSIQEEPDLSGLFTEESKGIGEFTSELTNLDANTIYFIRPYVCNSMDTVYGTQQSFTTMDGVPEIATGTINNVTAITADYTGGITDDGGAPIVKKGVCWSINMEPTVFDNYIDAGEGIGDFTSSVTGLLTQTEYHIRTFVISSIDTTYGAAIAFTTSDGLPDVQTLSADNIMATSAQCSANINNNGGFAIIQKGICWSGSTNPTVEDNKTEEGGNSESFISDLTNLDANTRYYLKAYAINEHGTSYGEELSFATLDGIPVISVGTISNIAAVSVDYEGNVTADGGAPIVKKGVCWSINMEPTVFDNYIDAGEGTGEFTSSITGLLTQTEYHLRAFVINSIDTTYGAAIAFTTSDGLPEVQSLSADNILATSAQCSANVNNNGGFAIIQKGICWSGSTNPTVEDNKTEEGGSSESFVSELNNLDPNTKYYYRAYATNEHGTAYGEELYFTTLDGVLDITTNDVINISAKTASCGGTVANDEGLPITAKGVCWSTSPNPTITDANSLDGDNTGSFSSEITGLELNTEYFVRAYATNTAGTSYGDEKSFTTKNGVPIIINDEPRYITDIHVRIGATITDNGGFTITKRGLCWKSSPNPLITDGYTAYTENGTGTGHFFNNSSGLELNTTYYIKAYAINEIGTTYSEEISFTTLDGILDITTNDVINITANSASCGGSVAKDEGLPITAKGVCWSTSPNPTITDANSLDGDNTGSFSSEITDLELNTTYYVRAYATNTAGTSYGDEKSFTTKNGIPNLFNQDPFFIYVNDAHIAIKLMDDGGLPYTKIGVCWNTSPNPSLTNNLNSLEWGNEIFEMAISLSYLNSSTTYYVRGYVTNELGTHYSEEKSFTTKDHNLTITTNTPSSINATTATCGGTITGEEGYFFTKRGVCWSTNPNPTIANAQTIDGEGMGSFLSNVTELSENTTYYIRAYATNYLNTFYGDEISFNTKSGIPIINKNYVYNITGISAEVSGGCDDDGGFPIIDKGTCWGTSPNPTQQDNFHSVGGGIGEFTHSLNALKEKTTYYARTYIQNKKSVYYGEEQSFTTSEMMEGALSDYDGNSYKWVKIGTQIWMAENLKVTHYPDGKAIPLVTDETIWGNLADNNTDDAYCYYNNNANGEATTYGALYTYAAASDVCPTGWHLPNDAEWTELETFIRNDGHNGTAATALKSKTGWINGGNGTDDYGFAGLPGGDREAYDGSIFYNLYTSGHWWSSTESSSSLAWFRMISRTDSEINRFDSGLKSLGFSVRCVKD